MNLKHSERKQTSAASGKSKLRCFHLEMPFRLLFFRVLSINARRKGYFRCVINGMNLEVAANNSL